MIESYVAMGALVPPLPLQRLSATRLKAASGAPTHVPEPAVTPVRPDINIQARI